MQAENIAIGDELLLGRTINTNSAYIGEKLAEIGIGLKWVTTVGDDEKDIEESFKIAFTRADVVLVTGGLGPTHDDITKNVVAKFFDSKLVMDETVLEAVKERFRKRGIEMAKINETQALVPHNCKVIPNDNGTAPGMLFEKDNKYFIVMPGVPHEMKSMMQKFVIPFLKEKSAGNVIKFKIFRTTGIAESNLFEKIDNLNEITKLVKVAFLPKPSGVDIRLTAYELSEKIADEKLKQAESLITGKIEKWVYAVGEEPIEKTIGKLLREKKLKISVAESCTGGLIANRLTNIPGSSDYFDRGVIAYSNKSKIEILGVPEELIEKYGAVSEEVAKAMALGIRKISCSDIGLSTTGIAGPTGGTPDKPVGLVYIGVSYENETIVEKHNFRNDRITNKERFSQSALNLVRKVLTEKE
jgi:nicotinamide-nucleotide amidase